MSRVRDLLVKYEGLKLKPYRCTEGKMTIGVGRNLEDVGVSKQESDMLLDNDIARIRGDSDRELVWFSALSEPRKDVILLMLFQLGLTRFRTFRRFLRAMDRKDYDLAAKEMLDSDWAKQTPKRVKELAEMMRTGAY